MFSLLKCLLVFVMVCLALASAYPAQQEYDDLNPASSDHDHHHHERVHIKVYRGPTEHDGHHHHAPWGFWVKQPADDHHHHH